MIVAGIKEVGSEADEEEPLVVAIYTYEGAVVIKQHQEQLSMKNVDDPFLMTSIDECATGLAKKYPGSVIHESAFQVAHFSAEPEFLLKNIPSSAAVVFREKQPSHIVITAGQMVADYLSLRIAQAIAVEVN